MRRFAIGLLLALVVLALGTVLMGHHAARDEAIRDAQVSARGIARVIVAPLLDEDARAGDSPGRRELVDLLEHRMADGSIAHVKIWSEDGKVIWSDERRVVGHTYVLPAPVATLFGSTRTVAELPDAEKPVRGAEPDEADLLEVYAGSFDADGRPFVFETYTPKTRLAENTQLIFTELVPIGLLAMLLLCFATLPLAVSLARRVDREQRRRTDVLRHSLMAWNHERRRLAQDLHDGVVQDLASVGYAWPVVVDRLPEGPDGADARTVAARLQRIVVESGWALRELVLDLFPSQLATGGLVGVLDELAVRTERQGVSVLVAVDRDVEVDREVAGLVYRVVREGLRNVVKHAGAEHVEVSVRLSGDGLEVRVEDDGSGVGPPRVDADRHVGLDLLDDTLRDVGGELELRGLPGGGAVLVASMPVRLGG